MTSTPDLLDPSSLLSILYQYAINTPNNVFLSENHQVDLSFCEAYSLSTQLIPTRLHLLCPSLTINRRRTSAILLCTNTSLFPLAMFSLWTLSVTVVPISVDADPNLWAGIVNLIAPDTVLVSSFLKEKFLRCLDKANITTLPKNILEIESLIPPEFYSSDPRRSSDFIPSCHKWLESRLTREIFAPNANKDNAAVSLFTSSAVDWSSLKCVTYTHQILLQSGMRAMEMLGGAAYSSVPKRHLGWLPLSHCFEFCISFWCA